MAPKDDPKDDEPKRQKIELNDEQLWELWSQASRNHQQAAITRALFPDDMPADKKLAKVNELLDHMVASAYEKSKKELKPAKLGALGKDMLPANWNEPDTGFVIQHADIKFDDEKKTQTLNGKDLPFNAKALREHLKDSDAFKGVADKKLGYTVITVGGDTVVVAGEMNGGAFQKGKVAMFVYKPGRRDPDSLLTVSLKEDFKPGKDNLNVLRDAAFADMRKDLVDEYKKAMENKGDYYETRDEDSGKITGVFIAGMLNNLSEPLVAAQKKSWDAALAAARKKGGFDQDAFLDSVKPEAENTPESKAVMEFLKKQDKPFKLENPSAAELNEQRALYYPVVEEPQKTYHLSPEVAAKYFGKVNKDNELESVNKDGLLYKLNREELIYLVASRSVPFRSTESRTRLKLMTKYMNMDEGKAKEELVGRLYETMQYIDDAAFAETMRASLADLQERKDLAKAEFKKLLPEKADDRQKLAFAIRTHAGIRGAVDYYSDPEAGSGRIIQFDDGDLSTPGTLHKHATARYAELSKTTLTAEQHLDAAALVSVLLNNQNHIRTILKEIPKQDGAEITNSLSRHTELPNGVFLTLGGFAGGAKEAQIRPRLLAADLIFETPLRSEMREAFEKARESNLDEVLKKRNDLYKKVTAEYQKKDPSAFTITSRDVLVDIIRKDAAIEVPEIEKDDEPREVKEARLKKDVASQTLYRIEKYRNNPSGLNPNKYSSYPVERDEPLKYTPGLGKVFENVLARVQGTFINDYDFNIESYDRAESRKSEANSAQNLVLSTGQEYFRQEPVLRNEIRELRGKFNEFRKSRQADKKAAGPTTEEYDAAKNALVAKRREKASLEAELRQLRTNFADQSEIDLVSDKVKAKDAEIAKDDTALKTGFKEFTAFDSAISQKKEALQKLEDAYNDAIIKLVEKSAEHKAFKDLRGAFLPYKAQILDLTKEYTSRNDADRVNPAVVPMLSQTLASIPPEQAAIYLGRLAKFSKLTDEFDHPHKALFLRTTIRAYSTAGMAGEYKPADIELFLKPALNDRYRNAPFASKSSLLNIFEFAGASYIEIPDAEADKAVERARDAFKKAKQEVIDEYKALMKAHFNTPEARKYFNERIGFGYGFKSKNVTVSDADILKKINENPDALDEAAEMRIVEKMTGRRNSLISTFYAYMKNGKDKEDPERVRRVAAFSRAMGSWGNKEVDPKAFAELVQKKYDEITPEAAKKIEGYYAVQDLYRVGSSKFSLEPKDMRLYLDFIEKKFDSSILVSRYKTLNEEKQQADDLNKATRKREDELFDERSNNRSKREGMERDDNFKEQQANKKRGESRQRKFLTGIDMESTREVIGLTDLITRHPNSGSRMAVLLHKALTAIKDEDFFKESEYKKILEGKEPNLQGMKAKPVEEALGDLRELLNTASPGRSQITVALAYTQAQAGKQILESLVDDFVQKATEKNEDKTPLAKLNASHYAMLNAYALLTSGKDADSKEFAAELEKAVKKYGMNGAKDKEARAASAQADTLKKDLLEALNKKPLAEQLSALEGLSKLKPADVLPKMLKLGEASEKDAIKELRADKEIGGAITLHAYATMKYEQMKETDSKEDKRILQNNFFATQVHLLNLIRKKGHEKVAWDVINYGYDAGRVAAGVKKLEDIPAAEQDYAKAFVEFVKDKKNADKIKKLEAAMPYQKEEKKEEKKGEGKGKDEPASADTRGAADLPADTLKTAVKAAKTIRAATVPAESEMLAMLNLPYKTGIDDKSPMGTAV